MSNSTVRRTVRTTASVWAVLILAVIIHSILGVTVAGVRPEASRLIIMITLPFTVGMSVVAIGAAMAIGWCGAAGRLPVGTTEMVKLHLELEGDVGEVVRVLRRIGGGDNEDGEVRDGSRPAASTGERTSAVDTVPEPGTTATSATLVPGRWTEELAADFTAGPGHRGRASVAARVGAGAAGIHRSALCQRTDLAPAELRSLLMRMGHVLRRFHRERGMALPRPVGANTRCRATSSIPTSWRRRPTCSGRGCRASGPVA